jgi:Transglycosylase SLT domain
MVSTISASGERGQVHRAIYNAASATGVDFNYLYNQARVESSLNPDAKARTSSATGLYQFIEQSWLGVVAKHGDEHGLGWASSAVTRGSDGRYRVADPDMRAAILDLRRDPDAAAAMAAEFASDNRDHLERRLGHAVESVDLYLAHFLGAAGATKFLRNFDANPEASAADLFPSAARSNRGVFFKADGSARTLNEVRERFAAKFEGASPALEYSRHAELVSASISERDQSVPTSGWTLKQVQGDGMKANARLAYLMLASLGVSA